MSDLKTQTRCPHCDDALEPAALQEGKLKRCRGCGFIFPSEKRHFHDSILDDHHLIPCDRYRLIKPLHSWGVGRVYLALHLVLDEPCVVKVLSTIDPEYSQNTCRHFMEEAKAGFRIKHPNVARVLDCDRSGEQWYFVMEYVDGANLSDILRSCGRLAWTQVVEIGSQGARGLTAIHEAGLCHRDIKPSNIILCPNGSVKIADLGLVQFLQGTGTNTASGSFGRGTPQYMSPEQRSGAEPLDERTDIYALGATMYHLLVGHPPCRGHGPLDYLTGGDTHAPLEWPRDVVPAVPKWLRQTVEKCLSPNREQRFASADALARELNEWLDPAEKAGKGYQVPGIGTPRGVVVLPFENLSADAAVDWVGNALAEEIHNTLLAIEGVQMVDRHELLSLLGCMYAERGATMTNAQTLNAARRVGAAVVVRGVFQREGGRLTVTASRLDSDHSSGRLLTRVTGRLEDILDLQADLGREVAAALGYHSARRAGDGLGNAPPPSAAVRRFYAAGQSAYTAGHYAKAIECCQSGLGEDPDFVELLSLTGVCCARLGEYDRAITCHRRLETIARQRDDPHRLVEATGNLGVMYYYKGEYPLAYDLMHRAGDLAAELNLLPLLAKTCNNMGFVLTRMERLVEADQAFEEAIHIKLSLGVTASLVSPYNGRGEIALQQGRNRDALDFYRQALEWARKLSDRVNIGICHTNIGRCFFHMQHHEEAERHLSEALANLASTEFWNGQTLAYEQLAELHLTRKHPQVALDYIEKRIDLAQRHENRYMEAAAWEQKSRAYELSDHKDEAMQCLRKSFQLQQSKSPYEPLPQPSSPRQRRGARSR